MKPTGLFHHFDNKGFSLIELLVAMPLMAILLATMVSIFALAILLSQHNQSNLELQQQLRFTMDSIVRDLTYANSVKIGKNEIEIKTSRNNLNTQTIVYRLNKNVQIGKVMKDNQPVTGESRTGLISVLSLNFKKINDRTILIEIIGENQRTKKCFTLETAVILLNKS